MDAESKAAWLDLPEDVQDAVREDLRVKAEEAKAVLRSEWATITDVKVKAEAMRGHWTILNDAEKSEVREALNADSIDCLLTTDAKFVKSEAEFAKAEAEVVDLAVKTLDPKDMLKNYAKLGRAGLKLAERRKASLKAGSWNGKVDLKKVCDDLGVLIRSKVAIKTVEMDKYIRIDAWVEAMRPLVKNVERLSYFQVYNKFLPTIEFDAETLTGEIRKGWIGWLTQTVERQISGDPMPLKELDAAIAERKAAIEKERDAKRKPISAEEEADRAAKVAESKRRKEKDAAQTLISDSIDKAIETNNASPADVAEIAEKVLKSHNMAMPKLGSFDPETCTANDVKMLAKQLFTAGKISEMRLLRDTLDQMIKVVDNALVTSRVA
jgi:hypothetical protein